MMRYRAGIAGGAALIAALALPGGVEAQTGSMQGASGSISLDRALELARVGNPTVQRATNQLALNAPEKWNYLFGQLLPSVTLDVFNTGYSGNLQRRARDVFGNPIESPSAEWVYFSSTDQSLRLNWSFQGYSLFNARKRRNLDLTERDLTISSSRWALRGQVQRQYFDALEQASLLEVEQALLGGRRVDLESAERRFELGASQVEALNAEVQVSQQEIAIEQQQGSYEQALLTLSQTLGGEPVSGVDELPLPVFDPTALQPEALVAQALVSNPGLEEARLGVRGAQLGVQESKENWWPTVGISYSLSRTAQASETAALADFGYDANDIGSRFGINISVPAFSNYFQDRVTETNAQVQLTNQELTLQEQRLQVESDVRSGLIQLKNQWRSLQIAERSAEIAARSSELAREQYRLGILTFEDLQDTVEQEASTQRQALTTRFAFVDALLALEETIGEQIRPAGMN